MNNITQIKRGSTASWSLGPEMVQWENLDVWGKDSLIHCEGTDLEMNVYTASANYFYDENGQLENFKRPGLWLIKTGEIGWDTTDQVVFRCHVEGPSDCWLEVYSSGVPAIHGQKVPLNAGAVEMTVPYLGDWGIYMRWPEARETTAVARVKMSIRVKDAYEELAPGQLGVEYTDDGQAKLKVGMPNEAKWDRLPYIGGGEGSSSSTEVVDVISLPTTGIKENCLYRLLTATMINGVGDVAVAPAGSLYGNICKVVQTLPSWGYNVSYLRVLPGVTEELKICYFTYYNLSDNTVYGYIGEDLTTAYNKESGWYSFEELAENLFTFQGYTDVDYGGTITSVDQLNDNPDTLYVLLSYELYRYNNEQWLAVDIGDRGTGFHAEIFNSPTNVADGNYSHAEGLHTQATDHCAHAEGRETTASGLASHAEGGSSTAKGNYAHAEGTNTQATGNASHAEGNGAHAQGEHSHAEGLACRAEGEFSHAEGEFSHAAGAAAHAEGGHSKAEGLYSHAEGSHTWAVGRSQHVEGEYNLIDEREVSLPLESDQNSSEVLGNFPQYDQQVDSLRNHGKYIHIAGNGAPDEAIYSGSESPMQVGVGPNFYGLWPELGGTFEQLFALDFKNKHRNYDVTIGYLVTMRDDNGAILTDEFGEALKELQTLQYNDLKLKSFVSDQGVEYLYFGNGSLATYGNADIKDEQYPFVISTSGEICVDPGRLMLEVPYYLSVDIVKSGRSNAYTLDWKGNAWFAGDIYIGGMGQDDPDAKKLGAGGGLNSVEFVEQELTQEQKDQARKNIGAAGTQLVPDYGDNILPIEEFEPFYHLEAPEATNLIITQQDGFFRMNGTLQRFNVITPFYKQQSTGKVDLEAGKTYYLGINGMDGQGTLTNLKVVRIEFFDGESISSEDLSEEYTPQENKEIKEISITLRAFSIDSPVEIQNESFLIYLGEKEKYSFEGQINKALMPQDQFYSKNHQIQMRKNIGARGERYIITLEEDDNGWFTKTTWTELVDAYQGGKEVVVTEGLFLMTNDFSQADPEENGEFYASINYGGEFVDVLLSKGLNNAIDVVYNYAPLTVSINGVESNMYGPTDFTEVINEMIEAKIAAVREEAYQAGYAQGKAEAGQEG